MSHRFRRLKIGTRLLVALLVAVIVPSVVVAAILIRSTQSTLSTESFRIAAGVAETAADDIGNFTSHIDSLLTSVGIFMGVQSSSSGSSQLALDDFLNKFKYLRTIVIRYADGRQVSTSGATPTPSTQAVELIKAGLLKASTGGTYRSPVFFDSAENPYIVMAVPVMSGKSQNVTAAAAVVSLSPVNSIISGVGVGQGSYALVVDSNGEVIAQPPSGIRIIGKNIMREPFIRRSLSGRADTGYDVPDVYTDPFGRRVVGVYRYISDLKWSVIVEQPSSPVAGLRFRRIAQALSWTLLFSLLFFFIGMYMVWRIRNPISALSKGAAILGYGDLDYRIRVHSGDELEDLANTLNDMAANLAASRRRLEEEHQRVVSSAKQVRTLYRVSQSLVSTLSLPSRLEVIAENLALVCKTDKVMVWLIEKKELIPYASHGLDVDEQEAFKEWRVPLAEAMAVTRQSLAEKLPISVKDVISDDRIPLDVTDKLGIHSLLSLPFVFEDQPIGYAITYEAGKIRRFTKYQMNLAQALASQGAIAIQNSRAYERERRIAETLQRSFLPDVPASMGDFDIADKYAAALTEAEIGGDFYDVMQLSPSKIGLVISDVSGKGLSAAVHTALIKYLLRGYAIIDCDPAVVIAKLNTAFLRFAGGDVFSTAFYGVLDVETKELTYTNAGHELPLLYSEDRGICMRLNVTGTALGVMEGLPYSTETVRFVPGDVLLMYTDGATEARRGKQFLGIDGLEEVFCTSAPLDARQVVEDVDRRILEFANGVLRDDIALLVVKYRSRKSRTAQERALDRLE